MNKNVKKLLVALLSLTMLISGSIVALAGGLYTTDPIGSLGYGGYDVDCTDDGGYASTSVLSEVSDYTSYCDVDASLTAYNLRSGEYVDWGSDSDSDDMLAEVSFSTTGEYVGYSISTSHYASITNDYDSDYCSDGFYVTNE